MTPVEQRVIEAARKWYHTPPGIELEEVYGELRLAVIALNWSRGVSPDRLPRGTVFEFTNAAGRTDNLAEGQRFLLLEVRDTSGHYYTSLPGGSAASGMIHSFHSQDRIRPIEEGTDDA